MNKLILTALIANEVRGLVVAGLAVMALSGHAHAANLPLSSLTARGTPQNTDLIPILPAGASSLQSVTYGQIEAAIAASVGTVQSLTCGTGLTGGTITVSGTCALANPSPTTLGGVESYAAVTHQFITAISTAGVPASAQPACADLSNAAASCATDATNASNIASGTLGAARLAASGVTAAAYGDSSHIPVVTVDVAGRVTGASTVSIAASIPQPQGRLTLASATPVLTADVTGAATLYYDCYAGRFVPYYTGSADAVDAIGSCEVSTALKASGTGVESNGDLFDVFWVHAAATICVATNGSGGGWSADTGGSLTARGSGFSNVHNTKGYWTNGQALAHCYNGATDEGSISTDQATYLGTFLTTAAGQTSMQFLPSGAAGGSAPILGLYNAYNRVDVTSLCEDTTSTWNESTAGWHALHASTANRASWVDGLAQSPVRGVFDQTFIGSSTGTTSAVAIGIDLDTVSGSPFSSQQANGTGVGTPVSAMTSAASFNGQIGLHFVQEVANGILGTVVLQGLAGPGRQNNALRLTVAD